MAKQPLLYSTVPEALDWLRDATGTDWTENGLLDTAARCGVTLHAANTTKPDVVLYELDLERRNIHEALIPRLKLPGWRMGVLYPRHIAEILHTGQSETVHADSSGSLEANQHLWFSDPVPVTRDHVRVSADALWELAAIHKRRAARDLAGSAEPLAGDSPRAAYSPPAGRELVTADRLIECYRLDPKRWRDRLSHLNSDGKRYKEAAKIRRVPGRTPNMFDPALFGVLLFEAGELKNLAQLRARLANKTIGFPGWLDELERLLIERGHGDPDL